MKKFNRVAIIGVGLIGGSIGFALKKAKLVGRIIGVCKRQSSLNKAIAKKVIDKGTLNIIKAVKDVDLVVLALPVGEIVKVIEKILPYLSKGCIVIDVGSTKEIIVKKADQLFEKKDVFFVGTHPMAGSEKSGVSFASADLFKNTLCIITKTKRTNLKSFEVVNQLWKNIGAKTIVMTPQSHDKNICEISHLPHIIAVTLVNSVSGANFKLASTGFKDVTRIAESNSIMWKDIFLSNKQVVVKSLDKYINALKKIRSAVNKSDAGEIVKLLKTANKKRSKI